MDDELRVGPWLAIHEELGVAPLPVDDTPLGTFIEEYARTIPDNGALRYFERDFSYRELNELSNRLANALAANGVGMGDVVGLQMPNIPQYVIAVVAVFKLGATVSSVSPLLVPSEVAGQLEDAGVKLLISLDTLAKSTLETIESRGSIPATLETVIVTGADDLRQPKELEVPKLDSVVCKTYLDLTGDSSPDFTQVDLSPDHICMIQYTGGTTGKPKGAMLALRPIMYHLLLLHFYRPWDVGKETVASAFPLFHVGGLMMVLTSLRFGAHALVIPDARDLDHYCQQMIKLPPTRLVGVPTLYQMIADNPLSAQIDFSKLKNAMTGSAPITGEDRVRIEAMLQGAVLSDNFGLTESGPTLLINPQERCKPEALGIPVPSVDVRIVDVETGERELPYGEAGEIIAASPCLMTGYLNKPAETANALREWHGKTWLHTGDVGVMDEEGYVYIKDRAKDMIVVSGFKVFSVEVEDKLSALEFIVSSALVGSPDPKRPGSEIVNLYVELTPEARQRDPDDVRADILSFCRAEMSAYKVPKRIHIIDAIPLTPVGKIDKKVLREQAAREGLEPTGRT